MSENLAGVWTPHLFANCMKMTFTTCSVPTVKDSKIQIDLRPQIGFNPDVFSKHHRHTIWHFQRPNSCIAASLSYFFSPRPPNTSTMRKEAAGGKRVLHIVVTIFSQKHESLYHNPCPVTIALLRGSYTFKAKFRKYLETISQMLSLFDALLKSLTWNGRIKSVEMGEH